MDNLLTASLPTHYSLNEIIINMFLASLMGIGVAAVYKRTHKGVSYSQSYVGSLVLVTFIAAVVVMVIGNSLTRAFGLIGAFSVIRFRSAVKDTRDITFLFFALTLGFAAGTGNYAIAILGFIAFSLLTGFISKSRLGKFNAFDYLLSFALPGKTVDPPPYLKLFQRYLDDHMLLSFRSPEPSQVLAAYHVRFRDTHKIKEFILELKKQKLTQIELASTQNDVDY